MKKVRLTSDEISIDELNDSHLIGVQFDNGHRAFVLKIDEGQYTTISANDNANEHNYIEMYKTIKSTLEPKFVASAYLFRTPKELYLWMAEGE